jgi:hypothetical protein
VEFAVLLPAAAELPLVAAAELFLLTKYQAVTAPATIRSMMRRPNDRQVNRALRAAACCFANQAEEGFFSSLLEAPPFPSAVNLENLDFRRISPGWEENFSVTYGTSLSMILSVEITDAFEE